MYCSECGKPVSESENFCPSCGHKVTPDATITAPIPPATQKARGTTWLKISGSVLLIGGIALGLWAYMHRPEAALFGGVTWTLKAEFYYGALFVALLLIVAAVMRLVKGSAK